MHRHERFARSALNGIELARTRARDDVEIRDPQHEPRASVVRFDAERAAVRTRDRIGDVEAEPEAGLSLIESLERLEEAGDRVGRNFAAGILDR